MSYVVVNRDLIWKLYDAEKHTGRSIIQLVNEALMYHFGMRRFQGRNFDFLFLPNEKSNIRAGKLIKMRRLIILRDFFFEMYKVQCDTGETIISQATRAIGNYLTTLLPMEQKEALENK